MKPGVEILFPAHVEVDEFNTLLDAMEQAEAPIPAAKVFHRTLRSDDKERVSLNHCLCAAARSEGSLVGCARVVTDHAYIYYILDVMVHPDRQREGLGAEMLKRMVAYADQKGFIKLLLTAIPGSEPFYERMGFRPSASTLMTMRGEDRQGIEA